VINGFCGTGDDAPASAENPHPGSSGYIFVLVGKTAEAAASADAQVRDGGCQ
jgi:hypothetical protein